MAADYTADQLNTVSRLQNISAIILDQLNLAQVLVNEAIDKGYGNGGTNAITDALLQNPIAPATKGPLPQLTATDVFNDATWLTNLITVLTATSITTTGTGRTGFKALERMRP